MKSDKTDSLPPDVEALFEAERAAEALPPPGVRDDLTRRLGALLGPPSGGGGSGEGGTNEPGASGGAGGATAAAVAKAMPAAVKGLLLVAAGVVTGGMAVAVLQPPRIEVRYVERPVASAAPLPPEVPVPVVRPSDLPSVVPSAPAEAPLTRDQALARERALVETARSALARRDGISALASLDQHARLFPQGQFVEEREALAVQALVVAGRVEDAKTRAALFRRTFPKSFFGSVVEATLDDGGE